MMDQPQQHNTKKSLGIPMHQVTEIEIAEITKVVENAQIFTNSIC